MESAAWTGPRAALHADDVEGRPRPAVLLLPYAGAAHAPVQMVRRAVGPSFDVVAPTLPGHGRRVDDEPFSVADDLLDWLGRQVDELGTRDLVLLGISMGGRLAYELAWRLTDAGRPPAGVVVCVSRAPHTGIGHRPVADLPADEFARAAVDLGMLAPGVAELAGAQPFVRALRADLAVLEDMPPCRTRLLDAPSAVVGAESDPLVPEPALRAWSDLLRDPEQLRVPGGHLDWLQDDAVTPGVLGRAVRGTLARRTAV